MNSMVIEVARGLPEDYAAKLVDENDPLALLIAAEDEELRQARYHNSEDIIWIVS